MTWKNYELDFMADCSELNKLKNNLEYDGYAFSLYKIVRESVDIIEVIV